MREIYVCALKQFSENGRVQETLEPDYLIDRLKSKGIITQKDADDISAKSSRLARQKELLLELIPKGDDNAFQALLDVMDVEHYHWAREILEHTCQKLAKKIDKRSPSQD